MSDHLSSEHLSEETLNEYLDGLLAIDTNNQVEAHLSGCTVCTEQAETLRQLFFDLEQLPDLALEKDLSKLVLQKVRPTVVLPRQWRWAVWGQFGLSVVLMVIALPTFIQSEWFRKLQPSTNIFAEPLTSISTLFSQIIQMTNEFMFKFFSALQAMQTPELPFSLITITLILIATGLLWVVGNGLLLKNHK